MTNIKSAQKRVQISEKKRIQNRKYKSLIKTYTKKYFGLIEEYKNNPTQELLKLTEFELSKLEKELIKTPTSSPIRGNLELGVDDLLQQKKFLTTMIQESNQVWFQKLEKLTALANDFRLEPLPPLPAFKIELEENFEKIIGNQNVEL